ncbi:MAG: glycerophosphodiester phosphodiesterase family protein [Eubacteriales bacterium]|nr:glycerophosphodiester phosphodiesterase family protein [Eubacteriales bacterium]
MPKLIAHRGGANSYPEMSLAAIKQTLLLKPWAVEVDLRFTCDDKAVIHHDSSAQRLFGVDRLIRAMSLEEYSELRYLTEKNIGPCSLEELLQLAPPRLLFHMKDAGNHLRQLLALMDVYQPESEIIWGLTEVSDFDYLVSLSSRHQVFAFPHNAEAMEDWLDQPVAAIRLWEKWLTSERIQMIHAAGKKVLVMVGEPQTVGEIEISDLKQLIAGPIDFVLLNNVENAISLLTN